MRLASKSTLLPGACPTDFAGAGWSTLTGHSDADFLASLDGSLDPGRSARPPDPRSIVRNLIHCHAGSRGLHRVSSGPHYRPRTLIPQSKPSSLGAPVSIGRSYCAPGRSSSQTQAVLGS